MKMLYWTFLHLPTDLLYISGFVRNICVDGDKISLDQDVRLKIETVKDADEKEWIGVFTSSEEMHKGLKTFGKIAKLRTEGIDTGFKHNNVYLEQISTKTK